MSVEYGKWGSVLFDFGEIKGAGLVGASREFLDNTSVFLTPSMYYLSRFV